MTEREKEMKTRSLKIAGSNCRTHSVSLHFNASNFISSHFAFCKSYQTIFSKSSSIEYMYSFKEVATGHFQTADIYVGLGLQNVLPFGGSLLIETVLVELELVCCS